MPHPASRVHFRIRAYIPCTWPRPGIPAENVQLAPVVHLRFTRQNLFKAAHARCRQWRGYLQTMANSSKHACSGEGEGQDGYEEGNRERNRGRRQRRRRRRRTRGEEVKESADGRRSANVSIVVVWGGHLRRVSSHGTWRRTSSPSKP